MVKYYCDIDDIINMLTNIHTSILLLSAARGGCGSGLEFSDWLVLVTSSITLSSLSWTACIPLDIAFHITMSYCILEDMILHVLELAHTKLKGNRNRKTQPTISRLHRNKLVGVGLILMPQMYSVSPRLVA